MGGGVGLIDIDGDGLLDVYLTNGGPIEPGGGAPDSPCRLYRNLGGWRFQDITATANCPGPGYAMGVAVGDHDGDGRDDLFVTGWREQRLYRNVGGGRFEDVTDRAGLLSDRWSTSAAFADLDRDGDLDLYVCCYVAYDAARAPYCSAPDGRRDYCGPEAFDAQRHRLYRNNGEGTFTDVSDSAGIAVPEGPGLGVLVADLTGDDRLDIFVANDGTACRLFENRGDLRFIEVGETAGVAFDGAGGVLAGMGTALGDIDGDGRAEVLVGNFLGRSTIAFQPLGAGRYRDASTAFGLVAATRSVLGFGLGLADFDGDGRLDLLQANGHVLDRERLGEPLAMRPTLLRNEDGRFVDASGDAGPFFSRPVLGRGVAIGDLDHDGRPDAVVAALDAPTAVLRNESPGGRWLAIRLDGAGQGIGARVRVRQGDRDQVHVVPGGGSYLSSSGRALHVGLGTSRSIDLIEVGWPSGRREVFGPFPAGSVRLREGTGRAP